MFLLPLYGYWRVAILHSMKDVPRAFSCLASYIFQLVKSAAYVNVDLRTAKLWLQCMDYIEVMEDLRCCDRLECEMDI